MEYIRLMRLDPEPTKNQRRRCTECNVQLPKGCDRPFCVNHSPYAQMLMLRGKRGGKG